GVDGVSQRLGQVHRPVSGDANGRVFCDHAVIEGGQRHRHLGGGAGLVVGRKRQRLVDHGQNAAVVRIHYNGGPVEIAQRLYGGLTNDRIVTSGDVVVAQSEGHRLGGPSLDDRP